MPWTFVFNECLINILHFHTVFVTKDSPVPINCPPPLLPPLPEILRVDHSRVLKGFILAFLPSSPHCQLIIQFSHSSKLVTTHLSTLQLPEFCCYSSLSYFFACFLKMHFSIKSVGLQQLAKLNIYVQATYCPLPQSHEFFSTLKIIFYWKMLVSGVITLVQLTLKVIFLSYKGWLSFLEILLCFSFIFSFYIHSVQHDTLF